MCFFFTITALTITIVSTAIRQVNEIGRPRNVVTTQTCNGKMKTKNRLQGETGDVVSLARRDRCFDDSYVNNTRCVFRMLLNANFQIANKTIIVYNSARTRWPYAICTSFIVPCATQNDVTRWTRCFFIFFLFASYCTNIKKCSHTRGCWFQCRNGVSTKFDSSTIHIQRVKFFNKNILMCYVFWLFDDNLNTLLIRVCSNFKILNTIWQYLKSRFVFNALNVFLKRFLCIYRFYIGVKVRRFRRPSKAPSQWRTKIDSYNFITFN